jgi:methyltransferase
LRTANRSYLVLQIVRYWVISSLGRFWTRSIITLPSAPTVVRAPYRYLPHPNYAVTIVETFLSPLAFGAFALAAIMTALWWTVLNTKMRLEDTALKQRRNAQRLIASK